MSSELPGGWVSQPLSSTAKIAMGETLLSKNLTGIGVPVFSANTDSGPWGYTDQNRRTLKRGAIVVGARGSIGFPRLPAFETFTSTQTTISVEPDASVVDSTYLHAVLCAADVRSLAAQQAVPMLTIGMLAPLPILLPPLEEQRRIAEVLRSVGEVLSLVEQKARQAELALSAYSAEAFAHAVVNDGGGSALEDLLSDIIDYRGVPPPKASAGVPLLTAKNVRFGYLDPEPREFIAEEDYDSWMRRGLPTAGDVMFTTEAPLGNVAGFPSYRAALGQRTLTLRPQPDRLTSNYLKWLLLSPNAQALIHRHATGSTAKGIKQSTFRKLRFSVPTLDEQAKVGAACDAVWAVVVGARDQIRIMSRLRAMLSDDLLSGRVRVPA